MVDVLMVDPDFDDLDFEPDGICPACEGECGGVDFNGAQFECDECDGTGFAPQ